MDFSLFSCRRSAATEMTGQKFWTKVAVLAALTMTSYTQAPSNMVVSPLTENSFQDNSACMSYLNTTFAGFMIKLNRPVNASVSRTALFLIFDSPVNVTVNQL